MRDYLKEYAAKSTHKVDLELADKYDYPMRREGDKPIKALMAKARRAATAVSTLLKDFQDLPEKQAKEITSSATTLRNLADSMEGLAKFAKGYHAFYVAEIERERVAALEVLAQQRWGDDVAALEFEHDLMRELCTEEGQNELGRWFHANGEHQDVALKDFLTSFTESNLRGGNRRIEAAAALKEVSRETSTHNWGPKSCHLGRPDYERYLTKRKEAASASAAIIKTIQKPKAKG